MTSLEFKELKKLRMAVNTASRNLDIAYNTYNKETDKFRNDIVTYIYKKYPEYNCIKANDFILTYLFDENKIEVTFMIHNSRSYFDISYENIPEYTRKWLKLDISDVFGLDPDDLNIALTKN